MAQAVGASISGMAETGKKELLSFNKCTLSNDKISVAAKAFFTVQINPTKYHKSHKINYQHNRAIGHLGSESKFVSVSAEKIDFEFCLDGTGIIGQGLIDVFEQLTILEEGLYQYDGDKHEPNRVQVIWGELVFIGRLEEMEYEHELFKPNGKPLRTKIKMSFVQSFTATEIALRKNKSSPDLSHLILVKAGDTLPNLCHKIYRDSRYYLKIAKLNQLPHSAAIYPGMQLHFPPLEK